MCMCAYVNADEKNDKIVPTLFLALAHRCGSPTPRLSCRASRFFFFFWFRFRVPGDNFYRYEATVSQNPIITKALTSCVAYGLGDLTAQLFTVSAPLNAFVTCIGWASRARLDLPRRCRKG